MKLFLRRFWRSYHRWVSILVALPFLVTLSSGLLLATRAFNPWMQPRYVPTPGRSLRVSFDEILRAAQSVPAAKVRGWDDVSQIDVRPKSGQIRIRSKHDDMEIQVDGESGQVLLAAPRRVSWFTSLHEGALFGEGIRYGVFLPSAFGVLFLALSGLVLFFQPWLRRPARPRPE